jgi:protein SCO1/2
MSKQRSNKTFLLGLAVALLLPLSFYIVARVLNKDKIKMPHYYRADKIDSKTIDGKTMADTAFHQVNDITLVNQLGDTISLNRDLKGKILAIDFFFVSCPSVCPKLTGNMKMLQRAFRKDPKKEKSMDSEVQLISITVNPKADSVSVLRAYADKYTVNHDKWWFLTGNKEAIYNYARNELGLSLQPGDGDENDFIHTQKIVVLDQDRYIRGYYDGLDTVGISQCAYDISLLSMENKKRKKTNQ